MLALLWLGSLASHLYQHHSPGGSVFLLQLPLLNTPECSQEETRGMRRGLSIVLSLHYTTCAAQSIPDTATGAWHELAAAERASGFPAGRGTRPFPVPLPSRNRIPKTCWAPADRAQGSWPWPMQVLTAGPEPTCLTGTSGRTVLTPPITLLGSSLTAHQRHCLRLCLVTPSPPLQEMRQRLLARPGTGTRASICSTGLPDLDKAQTCLRP